MAVWVLGAAVLWVGGACALALLLGVVLRRGRADRPAPEQHVPGPPAPAVCVPAQRGAPATPPHGMRSQAHLSCAGRSVR